MTPTPAFGLLATLAAPATSARATPHDPGQAGGDAWQRALDTASLESRQAPVRAAEAGYMLALASLGTAAAQAASPALPMPRATAPRAEPPSPAVGPQSPGAGDAGDRAPAASAPGPAPAGACAHADARAPEAPTPTRPCPQASAGTRGAPAARAGAPARSVREGGGSRPASTAPVRVPVALHLAVMGGAPRPGPQQAVIAYAAAQASAPVSTDSDTHFELVSPAVPAPVRVHVQWRGRVADIWIGLHRRAFDQLPDIRAGIEDWVGSRGGAIGQLVCNGETLSGGSLPTFLQGAL